ncbi:hypothetical protein LJB81_04340, partial [Desulfovibrio sp. OttesenSCG-928-M14]|nr:hypothetical protein [Desulfovibrio sp. OttesenSCG-928-M14]
KRNLNPEAAARIIFARCPASEPLLIFSAPWPEHRQSGYALLVEFCDLSVYAECFYFYAPAVLAQELGKR